MRRVAAFIILLAVISLVLGLLCTYGHAQDLRITGFNGLQTAKGPLTTGVPPTDQPMVIGATRAYNPDLTIDGDNVLSRRRAFDSVSAIDGQDSIIDIFSFETPDRNQYLILVTDSENVAYGNVYITQAGSHSIDNDSITRIATKWPIAYRPSLAKRDGMAHMVNGVGSGILYKNGVTRSYPLGAAGEPRITPVTTAGNLDGEYYYMVAMERGYHALGEYYQRQIGMITSPVTVTDGQVILDRFVFQPSDSLFSTAASDPTMYTDIILYRTRANVAPLGVEDTFFLCKYVSVQGWAPYDTLTIVDNIADGSLNGSPSTYPPIPVVDETYLWYGRDSLGVYKPRYGAPGYVEGDTANRINDSTTGITGWGIFYTLYDTETGIEGKASVALDILKKGTEGQYTYSFPRLRSSDAGLVYRVYRAPIYTASLDSVTVTKYCWRVYYLDGSNQVYDAWPQACGSGNINIIRCEKITCGTKQVAIPDSITHGPFYLVDTLRPSTTVQATYTDTMPYSKLVNRPDYQDPFVPEKLSKIFFAGNQFIGIEGSNVYYTDSAGRWDLFKLQQVAPDDGDVITAAWPTRTTVRVTKQRSSYNLIGDDLRPELVDNKGCMAPLSVAQTSYGTYYMSQRGIELETEGQYLERTWRATDITADIDNIRKLPYSEREDAIAIPIPDEQKVIWQIGDTGFVWHEDLGTWVTWSTRIKAWALYDTTSATQTSGDGRQPIPAATGSPVGDIAGQALYIVMPGSSTLCRYRTNDTLSTDFYQENTGTRINISLRWKSVPLFMEKNWKWQPEGIGLWCSNSGATDQLYMRFLDENDQTLGEVDAYGPAMMYDSLNTGYQLRRKLHRPARYLTLEMYTLGNLGSTTIRGIDVWANRREQFR